MNWEHLITHYMFVLLFIFWHSLGHFFEFSHTKSQGTTVTMTLRRNARFSTTFSAPQHTDCMHASNQWLSSFRKQWLALLHAFLWEF